MACMPDCRGALSDIKSEANRNSKGLQNVDKDLSGYRYASAFSTNLACQYSEALLFHWDFSSQKAPFL